MSPNPHEQGFHKPAGCFVQGRSIDLSAIPDDVLRSEWQRRMVQRRQRHSGGCDGRPAVLRTCSDCHAQMSAREFRGHVCTAKTERRRAAIVAERTRRYLAWSRDLARQAARHLPPSVDLDDLQQIASMALMRCAAEYNDKPAEGYTRPTPFRVYAWRKVYFACLMAYRGRHYRDVTHEELPLDVATSGTEKAAARSHMLEALADAVLTLPPLQAAVVSLHYFRGLSIGEAARELQVSEGWASQAHTAGLRALREVLAARGVEGVGDWL